MVHIFRLSKNDRITDSTTSGGDQIKWVTRLDDKIVYIKSDDKGYESIAECLVSGFLHFVKSPVNYVDYYLCEIYEDKDHYYGCYSYNMLSDKESLVSLYRLFALNNIRVQDYRGKMLLNCVIQSVKRLTGIDITEDLQKVINLDAITLNEDRHFNNIALLYREGLGYTGLSPIFDNGLSLLSNTELYPLSNRVGSLMLDVRAKPFLSSFKQQVMLFQTEQLFAVDMENFEKACERFTTDCGRDKELSRAVSVLLRSLEKTEGLTWRALSC